MPLLQTQDIGQKEKRKNYSILFNKKVPRIGNTSVSNFRVELPLNVPNNIEH